jgi:catechol 2,3-dioxygenase-like lactoylglutathione lyase family enzyme
VNHPDVEGQITFLYTNRLAETSKFYDEIIGLDLVLDQGQCRIYKVSEDGYIGFCQKSSVSVDKSNVIFTIITPYVDEWYEMLTKKGVEFENPPQENPDFKIYHTFLRDPNGYLVEIQRFLDHRWENQTGKSRDKKNHLA